LADTLPIDRSRDSGSRLICLETFSFTVDNVMAKALG
jgi:hypothetical protein